MRVPGYNLGESDSVIVSDLTSKSILSDMDEIEINGVRYVTNLADGLQYPTILNKTAVFTKTVAVDSTVNQLCKSGISVFDSTKENRKELCRVGRNERVIMNMRFVIDLKGNIWAAVSIVNPDFTYLVENGYLIYKNYRNNFANLYIPGAKYSTILTAGELDNEKIEAVKHQDNNGIALLSHEGGNNCDCTTFVVGNKKSRFEQLQNIGKPTSKKSKSYYKQIRTQDPNLVQNSAGYPYSLGAKTNGVYQYNYAMDYSKIPAIKDMKELYRRENYDVRSIGALSTKNSKYYNRFKIANPDEILSRGFVHVFFTRPDCFLLKEGDAKKLNPKIKNDPTLKYLFARRPDLVRQLSIDNGFDHDFNLFLSNRVHNFSLTDEGAGTGKYGKSLGGYNISFIRRKDSETGGTFQIKYKDSRDLEVMSLHKLWMDYAVNVYRGKWSPKLKYIWGKIIDYACSVFVVVTAEDFETVLFWTKYYGVFPTVIPYSELSWEHGNMIGDTEPSVTYAYSWKEDYNPLGLTDLNTNAFRGVDTAKCNYAMSYVVEKGSIGTTWVGPPYVEVITHKNGKVDLTNGSKVTSKLRFKVV